MRQGKVLLPMKKIATLDSLYSIPENQSFFVITTFYDGPKQSNVSGTEYENPKFSYKTLKMRNFSDMKDPYNFQAACLLYKLFENKFEIMHKLYGFNPIKCNSASILSGSTERDLSKVIIALPTNTGGIQVLEKIIAGGLSFVNTRSGFDTEILLPNHCSIKSFTNFNPIYTRSV